MTRFPEVGMIKIHIDTRELERHFNRIVPADAHGAIVKALTWTARDAKDALVGSLAKTFTIRGRWIPGSIRSTPASFKDRLPFSIVGTLSDDLEPHVTGEEREARGKWQAVPVEARPLPAAVTRPPIWPRRALKKRRHFTQRLRNGGIGVFRRNGDDSIALLWALRKRVQIKRRWHFEQIVEAVVDARFAANFERGWMSSPVRR